MGDDQTGGTLRVMRKDRTGLGGVDLLVPRPILGTTWAAALAAGATPAGWLALDALRILAGRAAWPQDGTDKSMVHELGYNVDSVSFDKGCYLGQEVINRIERRGGIRKRLTRIRMDDNAVPPLGAQVRLGEDPVGTITSAARVEGTVWALATLKQRAWQDGTELVVQAGGQQVRAIVAAVE
ncbi:MAG: folate-binding protein YgfZ [Oligoflexia bacterium]|nr:folate-binding protein YgfZ [Oligoflexia bacterium]